eukprot:494633-Alexandrium_andersonii.AAC.1
MLPSDSAAQVMPTAAPRAPVSDEAKQATAAALERRWQAFDKAQWEARCRADNTEAWHAWAGWLEEGLKGQNLL